MQVNDGHGGTASQNVTIFVGGTNDTPVITSGAQTGTITELSGTLGSTTLDTASGAVTFTDADLSDTHTATVTGISTSGVTTGATDVSHAAELVLARHADRHHGHRHRRL